MARNDPQMNLRVPMELKEKIEKTALENGRTITAEAVYRLEESFNKTQPQVDDLESLKREIQKLNMTVYTLAEALTKNE